MTIHEVIRRPWSPKKASTKKDNERTLCFEVAPDANKTQVKAGGREAVQGEGGGSPHGDIRRQAAAARPVRRLPLGLEEGLREAEGRAEGARVRGDLSRCRSRHIRPTTPTRRFQTVGVARRHHQADAGEVAGRAARSAPAAATARAASPRGSSAAAHKQAYRVIDFKRDKAGIPAMVAAIEYDPNRSARIALLNYADGEKRYILQPDGLKVGQKVMSGPDGRHSGRQCAAAEEYSGRHRRSQHRTAAGKGAQMARSAGAQAQLVSREGGMALLKLPSGEVRRVPVECMATIGQVGNVDHENVSLGKAGRKRWMGKTPAQSRRVDEPGRSPARRRRRQDFRRPPSGDAVGPADARLQDAQQQAHRQVDRHAEEQEEVSDMGRSVKKGPFTDTHLEARWRR